MTTLAADLHAEIEVRCGRDSWIELSDLCDIFDDCTTADVHQALRLLARERKVRLVAIGCADDRDLSKCIRGEGEIYGAVELR